MLAKVSLLICCFLAATTLVKTDRHLMPDGTSVQYVRYTGAHSWQLLPNLWIDATVNVTCPDKKGFEIFLGPSEEALWSKVEAQQSAWCGWSHLVASSPSSCVARISAFGDTYVGAARPRTAGFFQGRECTFEHSRELSGRMIVQGIVGAALFLNGAQLSQSLAFRLGTGSLGFALLSVIILLFLVARVLPNKRSMAAAMALGGGALSSACQYFFGSYLPSLQQVVQNPVLLVYLGLSALVGLALTYYFDNPGNAKLMTILQVGLQLFGLGLVAFSTNLPEVSIALCCLLVACRLVPMVLQREKVPVQMHNMVEAVQQCLPTASSHSRGAAPADSPLAEDSPPAGHEQVTPPSQSTRALSSSLFSQGQGQGPRPVDSPRAASKSRASPSAGLVQREKFSFRQAQNSDGTFRVAATTPLPGETASLGQGPAAHAQQSSPPRSASRRSQAVLPQDQHEASPSGKSTVLEDRGMLINERTGRAIKVGSSTYQRLLQEGYQVDPDRGALTPPKSASGGSGTTQGRRRSRS